MDESAAALFDHGRAAGGRRGDCGGLVLFHAEIYAGGLSTDSAGGFSAFGARGSAWSGLPLLPFGGGEVVVFECAVEFDVHELP